MGLEEGVHPRPHPASRCEDVINSLADLLVNPPREHPASWTANLTSFGGGHDPAASRGEVHCLRDGVADQVEDHRPCVPGPMLGGAVRMQRRGCAHTEARLVSFVIESEFRRSHPQAGPRAARLTTPPRSTAENPIEGDVTTPLTLHRRLNLLFKRH